MEQLNTSKDFNEKYKDYLECGHYGLQLPNKEVIEYLDKEFQELIKLPDFKYSQIKGKFNWFCFYAKGVTHEKRAEIESKIKEIYER